MRTPASFSTAIDAALREEWYRIGLVPASRADDATFLRRAYLDIVGTGPPVDLTTRFLADTSERKRELFIYDLAVVAEYQRKGMGRRLVAALRADAAQQGVDEAFVPADEEDTHALDFYRAIGATAAPVVMFTLR